MEITQATSRPTTNYGHEYTDEDLNGYGVCGRCGARENSYYSAKSCRGHSLTGIHGPEVTPMEGEPVLAFIHTQHDLGPANWYEIVYHNGAWQSYAGSTTFDDGEVVKRWRYADGALHSIH